MQDALHIRTISVIASIICLVIFLSMFFIFRTRKTYTGFQHWTAASFSCFLGWLVLGFRNILPDFITIVMANALIAASFILIAYGLSVFTGLKHKAWPYAAADIFVIFAASYFTYIVPSVDARIVVISVFLAIFCLLSIFFIRTSTQPFMQGSNLLLETSCAIVAVFSIWRLFNSLMMEKSTADLMSYSVLQAVTLIIFSVLYIAVFFGLYILVFQRVEYDLLRANSEVRTLKGILPICASCKKIRDDQGYWNQVESYIRSHSEVEFSHAICPDCVKKLYPNLGRETKDDNQADS